MGQPLFKFDDGFIAGITFGMTDSDTASIFAGALESGRAEFTKSVQRAVVGVGYEADVVTTRWSSDGEVVVEAPEELLEAEWGGAEGSPRPTLRNGLIAARAAAEKAIERGLGG